MHVCTCAQAEKQREDAVMTGNEYFQKQAQVCVANDNIPAELYTKFDVKKGLRDKDGKGVITGITNTWNISQTRSVSLITGLS